MILARPPARAIAPLTKRSPLSKAILPVPVAAIARPIQPDSGRPLPIWVGCASRQEWCADVLIAVPSPGIPSIQAIEDNIWM